MRFLSARKMLRDDPVALKEIRLMDNYKTTLETERLILRLPTLDDFEAFHSWGGNPENTRYMAWGPNNEEETKAFLAGVKQGRDFAVVLKDTNTVIGSCGIYPNDAGYMGDLGWILHKDHWKRGYGTELGGELIRYGFEDLKLGRIQAPCAAVNYGSYRVMERNGMRREALHRKAFWARVDKEWIDEAWYAILAEDYFKERSPLVGKAASKAMADGELYLEIIDDCNLIAEFDTSWEYRNVSNDGKRYSTLQVSVKQGRDTVAYMNCFILLDEEVKANGTNLVRVADDDLNDDAYEAMRILDSQGLLDRSEKDNLYFLLATMPVSTVYLQHLAVREDCRKQGLGGWLLRNLPDILEIHSKICPNIVIVKLYPESVSWDYGTPRFSADLGDPDESSEMFCVMRKLLESCGYARHGDSLFFIKDFAV